MKFKQLAFRASVVIVLATMLGGCIVLPYGRGGHHRHGHVDRSSSHQDLERPAYPRRGR